MRKNDVIYDVDLYGGDEFLLPDYACSCSLHYERENRCRPVYRGLPVYRSYRVPRTGTGLIGCRIFRELFLSSVARIVRKYNSTKYSIMFKIFNEQDCRWVDDDKKQVRAFCRTSERGVDRRCKQGQPHQQQQHLQQGQQQQQQLLQNYWRACRVCPVRLIIYARSIIQRLHQLVLQQRHQQQPLQLLLSAIFQSSIAHTPAPDRLVSNH